jgi:hypothetical protein
MRKRMELIDIDKENITMTVEDLRKGLMNKGNPRFKKGIFRWKDWWDTGRCSGGFLEVFHSKGSEMMYLIKSALIIGVLPVVVMAIVNPSLVPEPWLATAAGAFITLVILISIAHIFRTIPYWNTKKNSANPSWWDYDVETHEVRDINYNHAGHVTTTYNHRGERSANWWYAPATHIVNGETRLCFGDVIKGENFERDKPIK